MNNNKSKKIFALILSAVFMMPCHAQNPEYTRNPNTGFQVKRGKPLQNAVLP